MAARKPHSLRNIVRIDVPSKSTKGWQINFNRSKITKFFSDSKYGSEKAALKEAQLFRDACERELQIQLEKTKRTTSLNKLTKRNTSGIPGVSKFVDRRPNRGKGEWQAQWVDQDGKHRKKTYSINKYGDSEAKRLAIEYRKRMIAEKYPKISIHPLFEPPENVSIKLWRYMDFTKFVSMLDHSGLYFTRSDLFDDLFVGSFSQDNKKYREIINSRFKRYREEANIDGNIGVVIKHLRKWVYISCWHKNDQESAAMWKLYSKTHESVCIQTTYHKLRGCLDDSVGIGKVRYADYQKEWIPENHALSPFFYKRLSFEHEKEYRAVINFSNLSDLTMIESEKKPKEKGVWKTINLNKLIENIHIAPEAPNWFAELVKNIMKKYKLNKKVIKSSLESEPFF